MNPQTIVIATCAAWPELSVSDATLADELKGRGHHVLARPWNDAPLDDFTSADLVVLRSTWDYHHDLAAFDNWLAEIDQADGQLHNPSQLVRQHHDKSYVARYGELGIPTPATLRLDEFDDEVVRLWMEANGLDTVVVKPAWGASGHGVERFEAAQLAEGRARWNADPDRRGLIAQQFMPEVSEGEYALVFFGHQFSHALLRQPENNEFRVNSQYGGTMMLAPEVDPAALALAAKVLANLSTQATYARIDVVVSGAGATLMEVEVNEPALGLHLAPGAPARFADALLAAS